MIRTPSIAAALLVAVLGFHLALAADDKPSFVKVTAQDLHSAYSENEVRANEIYKGKLLLLTGKVNSVKEKYVELQESDGILVLGIIHVHVEGKSKEKLASLKKGQQITVKGTCDGKRFAINITNAEIVD